MKKAKYAYMAAYSTDLLERISKEDFVLTPDGKTSPAVRGAATYFLNQRAGKHSGLPTAAQRRAMLLGQIRFFLLSAQAQMQLAAKTVRELPASEIPGDWTDEISKDLVNSNRNIQGMLIDVATLNSICVMLHNNLKIGDIKS